MLETSVRSRLRWLLVALVALVSLVATGLPGGAQEQAGREETSQQPVPVTNGQVAIAPVRAASSQSQPVAVEGTLLGDAAAAGTRLSVVLEAPDGTVLAGPTEVVSDPAGTWEAAFPAAATDELDVDAAQDYGVVLAARVTVVDGPARGQTAATPIALNAPPESLLVEANFTSSVGWVKPGETYPFRVSVRNLTADDGTNAVVEIPRVEGTSWASATPIGDAGTADIASDGTLTWDVGTVPAGTVLEPEVVTMIVEATADTLAADPQLVWKNLSATADLTADGVEAASETRGPRVIPPNDVYESARYGDRPFPVVPVDYFDREHLQTNSGAELSTVINDPNEEGSTFNLFQEMSYGQLFPDASIPSSDIATADWSDFDPTRLHEPVPVAERPDCATLDGSAVPAYRSDAIGTPELPERIIDGFYQLPGETAYYGADNGAFPNGDIDSGCGPISKAVYDAAAVADPEIDYNQFDTDKDGVVDFFMMVFVGCGGNGPSQRGCDDPSYQSDPYDNIWPHSSTLESSFIDDETGQAGYVTEDRLTNLEGDLLFYTDATYTATTTDETDYPAYVRVGPYNVNPEDALEAASVISHEYGHSLGLPDYYSLSPYGTEYYGTWNLMATDYSQHMDLNARQELGWVIPKEIPEDADGFDTDLVAAKTDINEVRWRTPDGTPYTLSGPGVHNGDAWMAPLPKSVLLDPDLVANGASPTHVYWSGSGDDFGCPPSASGKSLDIPLGILAEADPGDEVILEMSSYWDIEWDFDYGFLLATTNKGLDYEALPSREGYTLPADDNPFDVGCQDRFGNGLTGTSGSWEDGDAEPDRDAGAQTPGTEFLPMSFDLSDYAGQATDIRMAYNTDVAFVRPGWYVDDVRVTINGDEVYANDFESGPDDGVVNGGCTGDGAVLTGPCASPWRYIEAGQVSLADHAYYVEARDRTGFDLDSNGQADRGDGRPTWRAGVSLGYTDEYRGYGNTSAADHPNQHVLDANPVPFDIDAYDPGDSSTYAPSWDPDLDDAAWRPNSEPFSDFGDGHTDNYFDLNADDLTWTLDHGCLEMDVESMSGQTNGPQTPPGDLEAEVSFTRGPGCGERDYGFGQLSNDAPVAIAQTKSDTVGQHVEVTFDGGMSSDDLTPRDELTHSWDFDGDGSEDATGETAVHAFPVLGPQTVVLTVTDADGASSTDTLEVVVVDEVDEVVRIQGAARVETSVALSQETWDDGGADTAVIAVRDAFPDALASTSLAIAVDGPVLINPRDVLDPRVATELSRLGVDKVYIAGGEQAISASVEAELDIAVDEVERLAGATRTDTAGVIAAEVANLAGGDVANVILARADDFADSLSSSNLASSLDAPLVLTSPTVLGDAARDALDSLSPDTVTIVGGTAAISAEVEQAVRGLASVGDVVRLGGANRYETATIVTDAAAQSGGVGVMPTFLASGQNFPDALGAGPAAAHSGGQLLLLNPVGANATTLAALADDADTLDLAYIAGGEAALPGSLDAAVLDAIQTDLEETYATGLPDPDPAVAGAGSARARLRAALDDD